MEFSVQAYTKMMLHSIKYPHSTCSGLLLSAKSSEDKIDITDAIPISHASHFLEPNIEIAFNSISAYARKQELVIVGYYQTSNEIDIFSQRIAERISETYPSAVLCLIGSSDDNPHQLDPHQLVDGKWRRKSFSLEMDCASLDSVIYSNEKLYRKIVDFDEHFNDISLDWTNASVGQKIDTLVANLS